jgi:transposase
MSSPSWHLPEALWTLMEPRLPKPKAQPKGGRPPADRRKILASIFYVLRTGIHWKALPPCRQFVSGSTAHEHFQRWVRLGIFNDAWKKALAMYDRQVGLDWKWQSIDASMTKAPLGGEKNREKPYRPRQARYEEISPQ